MTPDQGESQYNDFHFNISIQNDSIEEPDEYFLLVLDIQELDVINVANERQCMSLIIVTDDDSKPCYNYWAKPRILGNNMGISV